MSQFVSGGLEGTSVLITGGGSGIGLGCAARFVADGAHVTICGRSEERLARAIQELEPLIAHGGSIRSVAADVLDEDAVIRAVAFAAELTGSLDSVIACAGGSETIGPVTQIDTEAFRRTIDLNITGTMLVLKHSARVMVAGGGGSFVGISSIAASNTHRWFGAYGPGKAGIEALCTMAADELGASAVRVNVIRPGLVDTELVEFIIAGGPLLDDYLDCMPISRVGQPADIAAMARFLIGSESTWITGQVINVDGGHSLRRGPDFSSVLSDVFGADGLRGVVQEG